jgi:hypothetical protein
MNDTRKIPCCDCGESLVPVVDYMEGDENEVVCSECEAKEIANDRAVRGPQFDTLDEWKGKR